MTETAAAAPAAGGGNTGPLGTPRGVLKVILLSIVTFGIYGYIWIYKSHNEIKLHSGEGVGGWVGLIIYLVIGVVTPFLLPQEIRKMYEKDGQTSPVSGKTGLWVLPGIFIIVGPIVWIVKVQGALNAYWSGKGAA
jgi:Domain of unknown function (DUF4234)